MSGGKGNARGTPLGGVPSPLLANIYMNRFLKHWRLTGPSAPSWPPAQSSNWHNIRPTPDAAVSCQRSFKIGDRTQQLAAMAERRNTDLFEVLIGQVTQDMTMHHEIPFM
jgi:hypothetical protein